MLLGGGRWVRHADGARLSVVVGERWRADGLAAEFAARDLAGDDSVIAAEDGWSARTVFAAELAEPAQRWSRGANEGPPPASPCPPAGLRLWAIAAGTRDEAGYLLRTARADIRTAPGRRIAAVAPGPGRGVAGPAAGPRLAARRARNGSAASPNCSAPHRPAARTTGRARPDSGFGRVLYRPRLAGTTAATDVGTGAGVAERTAKAGTKLVIVESPAKAKTIGGYLGPGYVVEASIGHIRDLPRNAADVPAKYKGLPWARIGVDTEHDFEPIYVVSPDRKQQVTKLKALVKDADELYLATDEDREGEAIAWHLVETLKPQDPGRADGLPRDHPERDRGRRRRPARDRRAAGRRAGDPPHPRPALRLRGQPGAVEEGAAAAVGRPRAVGRDPHGRRARAGADGVPQRRVLGRRGHVRADRAQAGRPEPRSPPPWSASTTSAGDRARLRPGDRTGAEQRAAPGRGRRARAWPRGSRAASSPSKASRTSRTAAGRTRRS